MKRKFGATKNFAHWGATLYSADEDGTVEVRDEHMATAEANGFVEVKLPEPKIEPKRETLHVKKHG